jgi:4-amino-4-deoxy-L-arabinose transferase-like glycosyltransferase
LNLKPFLEEPPLYYGVLALAFKAFGGASDTAARVPSALFAFATILVLFFLANSLFGPRTALFSGIVLATSGEFFRVAHWVIVDNGLTFFVMAAMALFITGYLSPDKRRKLLCYTLMYVSAALAFYAKGFIGIVIPGLAILSFLAMERNFREILAMRLWLGVLIFLAMTLPWFVALWHQAGAEHLKVFFLHNHLQRFLPASMSGGISGSVSGHHHPFYYYVTEFPTGFLPWSILLVPVLFHAFRKGGNGGEAAAPALKGRLFAKCWFFAGLVFLSVASTKRTLYLLPLFAPISMLTASFMAHTLKGAALTRLSRVFLWAFDILLLVIGLAMTPAWVYVKKAGLIGGTSLTAFPVVLISVLVTAAAVSAAVFLKRSRLMHYWVSICVPVILVLIFTLIAIIPILDRHKSFVPFCDAVRAAVPAGEKYYAYQPDETLEGVVPFYTGQFLTEIEEMGPSLLERKEPFYVMIRDRGEKAEKELLATGRLNVLVKYIMGTDRALVLLSNRPGARVVIGEDVTKRVRKGATGK